MGSVPEYTSQFVRIMLIVGLINTLQNPTMIALHATGNIKKVQVVESSMLLSVVPIAYILLKLLHISPVMVFVVYLVVELFTQFVRVYMIYPMINLRMSDYLTKVVLPISVVSVISAVLCYSIRAIIVVSSFWEFLIAVISYLIIILIVVFLFGLQSSEREVVNRFVIDFFRRTANDRQD